jgi:hypothetical protein
MEGKDPAFPERDGDLRGLTKREYFAAAALAGLVADGVAKTDAAEFAVIVADQLIDALNAVRS